jgi:hypothetical protein
MVEQAGTGVRDGSDAKNREKGSCVMSHVVNHLLLAGLVLTVVLWLMTAGAPQASAGERTGKGQPGPTLTIRPLPDAKRAPAASRPVATALERIVIPALQAEDKPAREVFDSLVAMARHEDPEKSGINLLFRCSAAPLKRRVTLDVAKLKLGELLGYVCQACGLEYVVEDFAVVIVDRRK